MSNRPLLRNYNTGFEYGIAMRSYLASKEYSDELEQKKRDLSQWELYHWVNGMPLVKFKFGDKVTRDGTDEQEIISIDYDFNLVTVRCTKSSELGNWCEVGDEETNLIRRYSLIPQKL